MPPVFCSFEKTTVYPGADDQIINDFLAHLPNCKDQSLTKGPITALRAKSHNRFLTCPWGQAHFLKLTHGITFNKCSPSVPTQYHANIICVFMHVFLRLYLVAGCFQGTLLIVVKVKKWELLIHRQKVSQPFMHS